MRFKRDVREWLFVRDSELWNLSEYERRILPALKLSYSHLPIQVERCLSFCSIFPRSYEFKKEKLIRLWMAESLIHSNSSSGGKEIEYYFTDLLWMSFFQEIKLYENGVVMGYKMHDIVYVLLQFVTSSEYTIRQQCGFGTPTSSKRIRHSSVVCDFRSSTIPEHLYEAGHRLRTLLLFSEGNFEVLPNKIYSSLKCSFALDLSGSGLTKSEGSIGAILHLTYLDLSHTRISKLLTQIEGLHSLQTLNLFNCFDILALPDLTKMKSLRHLNNDRCRKLTRMVNVDQQKYIGTINYNNQLQTLSLFVVGGKQDTFLLGYLMLREV
ncbi:NB-ARC domain, LRR domain containing protein [Parasponia andersonii]|uniref:NB-ARC domain, LRR domain containing protein n=1 Tax=Parasponia andersonii TaxID=3476 RepID=A0A2P5ATC0_PARAD|nr:NB-ARC domain, LRR domain containing protein [Parasponia andersonii]